MPLLWLSLLPNALREIPIRSRGIISNEQPLTFSLLKLYKLAAKLPEDCLLKVCSSGFLVAPAFYPELSHLQCSIHRFRDLVPRNAFSKLNAVDARH